MNPTAHAIIRWLSPAEGGRNTPPTGAPHFMATAAVGGDAKLADANWSVFIKPRRVLNDGMVWDADLSYMADAAPHELLIAGNRVGVYEGPKLVARGVVVAAALPVPSEVNDFALALIG